MPFFPYHIVNELQITVIIVLPTAQRKSLFILNSLRSLGCATGRVRNVTKIGLKGRATVNLCLHTILSICVHTC